MYKQSSSNGFGFVVNIKTKYSKEKYDKKDIFKMINKKYHMPDNRKADWVYDLTHKNKDTVVEKLKEKGISVRHSFKPLSSQPLFNYKNINKNAKHMSENVFYLNIDINKTLIEVQEIGEVVNEVLHDCDYI